jgi:outer membrane protein assembly factor BamB
MNWKYIYIPVVSIILLYFQEEWGGKKDSLYGDITSSVMLQNQDTLSDTLDIVIKIGTFLGNEKRNYYGSQAPSKLDLIWKVYLGKGETLISRKLGTKEWAGAGWTGQPLLVQENEELFLIQGAYDHHLKKIKASNGEIVWQYLFDDVVKGTGTIWINDAAKTMEEKYIILQGSRLGAGNYLDTPFIPSYRAVSYWSGKELWRMNSLWTHSYSRDVDGSALVLDDTAYIGLENGLFTVFDPNPSRATIRNGMLQPEIIKTRKLYTLKDVEDHKYNVVTESSPSLLNNRIYISSGSGHVYGINRFSKEIEWDFFIGSDMDGSAVVTHDSCILVPVEKQYIKGSGGIFKLDPAKQPDEAVVWFLPTEDNDFVSWKGGVIGSVGINDNYREETTPALAATVGIDGYLYIVKHTVLQEQHLVLGPDSLTQYPAPLLVSKTYLGPSISTPIFIDHRVIVAGYNGIFLFEITEELDVKLLDKFPGPFEATPIAWNKRIYIASRDGYLYCLGENP